MGGNLALRVNLPTTYLARIIPATSSRNGARQCSRMVWTETNDERQDDDYTWNARNQLGAFGTDQLRFDAFGRRMNAAGTASLYDRVRCRSFLVPRSRPVC
jgi:hypothetical protein